MAFFCFPYLLGSPCIGKKSTQLSESHESRAVANFALLRRGGDLVACSAAVRKRGERPQRSLDQAAAAAAAAAGKERGESIIGLSVNRPTLSQPLSVC